METRRRAISLVLVATLAATPGASGCRSMHALPVQTTTSQATAWDVGPGDDLRVALKDGRQVRFTVASVVADAVVATDGARYSFADIRVVERLEPSTGRTVLLVAGGLLAVLFVYMVTVATAVSSLASGL
jgi:hypothetical protein